MTDDIFFLAEIKIFGYETNAIIKFNALEYGDVVYKSTYFFNFRKKIWIDRYKVTTSTEQCQVIQDTTFAIDAGCLNAK